MTYTVSQEIWMSIEVEADSEYEARDKAIGTDINDWEWNDARVEISCSDPEEGEA
jgi:hypothetical protein